MAERRMFAKTIVLSDAFLDMPTSARCLYFTLSMFADDDGFVNSPKGIMRQAGASEDDMRVLVSKKFIITFDSGVVLIKHWKIHNYVRSDRYKSTVYTNELAQVWTDDDKKYHLVSEMDTTGIPNGYPGKDRDRVRVRVRDSVKSVEDARTFIPPTYGDVERFCEESDIDIDAQAFIDYYSQSGWKVKNGNQMTNWKSAVRNWHRRQQEYEQKQQKEAKTTKFNDFKQRNYNYTELEQRLLGM